MSDLKKSDTPTDVEKAPSIASHNHAAEAGRGYEIAPDSTLKRQLKDRHVAMISIGGP
jgi:amino acid permease